MEPEEARDAVGKAAKVKAEASARAPVKAGAAARVEARVEAKKAGKARAAEGLGNPHMTSVQSWTGTT